MIRYLSLIILLVAAIPLCAQEHIFEKLPTTVNDPNASQLFPVISADGHWLYFARLRTAVDGSTIFDIWRSEHNQRNSFKPAEFIGGNLSSRFGIAVTSISPDNNSLYLIGKLRADTPPEDRVMVSHRTASGWEKPTPIHIRAMNLQSLYSDYAFGPDGRTLLLSMASDSALGGRDLYVCFLDDNNENWSAPQWLGSEINSVSDEITPYLAADGKTLYFSSDRPGGIGEVDVWRCKRLDDSWKHFSAPEHLGTNINRRGRTTYYTEDAEGKYSYFVWREDASHSTAIYRSVAPKQLTPVTLIHGFVRDESGAPLESQISYELLGEHVKQLGIARTDPITGEYQITVPAGKSYALFAEKRGYLSVRNSFDATELTEFTKIEKDLTLVKIKENAVIALNNIFFATDQAILLPTSFAELDRLATTLLQQSELHISIEGHTDSTGSEDHNKKLSLARAEAVRQYLIDKKIDASRLHSSGFGSDDPIADNATEEGRAKNRRVAFRIVGK